MILSEETTHSSILLNIFLYYVRDINPTPVGGGGVFRPPYRKMAITPKNNDPKELKLRDFSYISMTNPPIPFLGLKMAKKGGFRAFLLSAVPISGS